MREVVGPSLCGVLNAVPGLRPPGSTLLAITRHGSPQARNPCGRWKLSEWVPAPTEVLGEHREDTHPYYLLDYILERVLVGDTVLFPAIYVLVTPFWCTMSGYYRGPIVCHS